MDARIPIETDVAIVGAGPVGLFQVFELGLLALKAHVIDSLPELGGQCVELYPDKPIYDIPAIPVCGAPELVDRVLAQIRPFAPEFHLGQQVTSCTREPDGRLRLCTGAGREFLARSVVIAAGVGAFVPRRLALAQAAAFEGSQIHYAVKDRERFRGKDIVLAGGGESAFDWVLDLVDVASSVVMLHRSQDFRAVESKVRRMRALCDAQRLQFIEGEIVGLDVEQQRLRAVRVRGRDGVTRVVGLDHLLAFFGLHPKLGPIAEFGLMLDSNQIVVDTAAFRTSEPGIYAVGDIATYPGKRKLILSGFHEATLAAFHIKEYLNPGQKVHLQYTTTSPVMHRRLGVASDPEYAAQCIA